MLNYLELSIIVFNFVPMENYQSYNWLIELVRSQSWEGTMYFPNMTEDEYNELVNKINNYEYTRDDR